MQLIWRPNYKLCSFGIPCHRSMTLTKPSTLLQETQTEYRPNPARYPDPGIFSSQRHCQLFVHLRHLRYDRLAPRILGNRKFSSVWKVDLVGIIVQSSQISLVCLWPTAAVRIAEDRRALWDCSLMTVYGVAMEESWRELV